MTTTPLLNAVRAYRTWQSDLDFCSAMLEMRLKQHSRMRVSTREHEAEIAGWQSHVDEAQVHVARLRADLLRNGFTEAML
jgi:hypothetical protein